MKCTGKEWDTCRVEKMGCKGCYYDYISKDKIREKIKYIKSNYSQINGDYFLMNNVIQVLQELLEEGESNENY